MVKTVQRYQTTLFKCGVQVNLSGDLYLVGIGELFSTFPFDKFTMTNENAQVLQPRWRPATYI